MNKNKILPISLFAILLIGTISMLPNADAVERYTGTDASKIEMECREGQVLIFKFTANTQLCTSADTAEMWEQMGVGQIVRSPIDGNSMDQSTTAIETTTEVSDTTEHHEIISPDQQIENGITKEDVICKSELTLMIRSSGSPACVQEDSIKELESRGWIAIEQTHEVKHDEEPKSNKDISVELEESVGLESK